MSQRTRLFVHRRPAPPGPGRLHRGQRHFQRQAWLIRSTPGATTSWRRWRRSNALSVAWVRLQHAVDAIRIADKRRDDLFYADPAGDVRTVQAALLRRRVALLHDYGSSWMLPPIPFNRPYTTGREFEHIADAIARAHLAGDGVFSRRCQAWLEARIGCVKALLTPSCTAALEMAVLLMDIEPGDEVVMPSYTFVSAANALVLRGGIPVFVDIRPDTLNIDERAIDAAITPRTRAIAPAHYAGVACEMDEILALARRHELLVIEDAAQALGSTYKTRPLGRLGDVAAISFHETKNSCPAKAVHS